MWKNQSENKNKKLTQSFNNESDVSDDNVVVDEVIVLLLLVLLISTIAIVYDDDDDDVGEGDGDEEWLLLWLFKWFPFNKSGLLLQRLWNESLLSSLVWSSLVE